jgi:protein-disulfide isomerase-like protein with CxxC motif
MGDLGAMGDVSKIEVTYFNDPGCPFGYSISPALAVLRWRYGVQLDWRLVTIGLAESAERYIKHGYTPVRAVHGAMRFRERYGMPFALAPRSRMLGTARACRAIVATRLLDPARELDVLRALQFGWFTTTLLLDEDQDIATVISSVPGLDVEAIVGALDDSRVIAAYEADKLETRKAEGSPTYFQGKARQTDGPVRYSAPSLIFKAADGRELEAGGFQTIEAYDVLIANLDPTLERGAPPVDPVPALELAPGGLVTQEVAAILAQGNNPPDRDGAERVLVELLAAGSVRRTPLGDDALWQAL